MLAIEAVGRTVVRLPVLVRVGLVGLLVAGVADVVVHLGVDGASTASTASSAAGETWAHTATLVSMVVVFLGVVIDGVRQGRARRPSTGRPLQGVE
jgi:hypothetical protein